MMQQKVRFLFPVVLLLIADGAYAQVCNISMTYNECWAALHGAPARATRSAAIESLDTVNTGSQTGSDTATEDFNPLIQASIDSQGLSTSDPGGITFAWNDFLKSFAKNYFLGDDGSGERKGVHHKLMLKLQSAEVYEPLAEAISDQSIIDDLDNSLDDFDDIAVDFRFGLNSEKYGRNINHHVVILDAIQRVSTNQIAPSQEELLRLQDEEFKLIQEISAGFLDGQSFDQSAPLESFTDAQTANNLIVRMESAHRALAGYVQNYEAAARRNNYFDFVDLVNNQPQLIFSAKARFRNKIAGPDEYSAKVVYEFGGVNVNTYSRFRRNACKDDDNVWTDADEVNCLGRFVSRNGNAISAGNRLAFSAEYIYRDSYSIDEFGAMLDLDEQSSFVAKLTYGRFLHIGKDFAGVGGRSRIDLSASYDDVSSDPTRHDRAIANFTFAQEIGDGLFLTASLDWANKPEFRVGADDDLTARFGISYKLPGQQ